MTDPLADGKNRRFQEAVIARERTTASFVTLTEENQAQAMERFAVLRSHLEDGIPLVLAIEAARSTLVIGAT